jgi:hypothetical protein
MAHLSAIEQRVASLEKKRQKDNVTLYLHDGSRVATTTTNMLDAMRDALYGSADPEETQLLMDTVENTSGSNIVELFQMVMDV